MSRPATEPRARNDVRILDVATTLFYAQGYHATTMRQIAAGVGMKAGSLYNHFVSKEGVLFRIAYDTMRELMEGALAAVDKHEDPAERLRAFIDWHVTYHAEKRFKAKVADDQLHALDAANREMVVAVRDEYELLLRSLISDGRERAGWTVDDVPVVAFAVATMCTSVGTWFREDGRLPAGEIARIYSDFVLAALQRP